MGFATTDFDFHTNPSIPKASAKLSATSIVLKNNDWVANTAVTNHNTGNKKGTTAQRKNRCDINNKLNMPYLNGFKMPVK